MLATAAATLSGCVDPFPAEPDDYEYRAVIRWTENGVPHILADDLASGAFGQGYAFARLNGCILADQVIKLRSERAKFFGAGEDNANIDSDFVMLHRQVMSKAEAGLDAQPEDIRGMLDGYVAGYNEYITTRGDELPCGGEAWLRPIDSQELMAHYVEIAGLASARALEGFILAADPPAAGLAKDPTPGAYAPPTRTPELSTLADLNIGSNGWGIGAQRSFNHRGMLLANPHFPWEGELRLYESHLNVPGKMNVYGASLMGVVGVLIGFNDAMAWMHPVSAGKRFTIYSLTLDPTDPTTYIVDGEPRKMEANAYTVDVRGEDGEFTQASRTMYRSHYGPVIAPVSNGLPWTRDTVYAFRDANDTNFSLIRQFNGMDRAKSLDEFQAVHALVQGIPWVNTVSASAEGEVWYADTCPTPNLSPDALQRWQESVTLGSEQYNPIAALFFGAAGAVVLDGSDSRNEWVEETGAREPGLVPFARMPKLQRSDFVFNANDSYWSTHPDEPLEGFSPMHGGERLAPTMRTRMNAVTLTEVGPSAASGPDGLFDLDELRVAALSNRGMVAELLRDAVVQRCEGVDSVTFEVESEPMKFEQVTVSIAGACDVLANWDRRADVGSVGAAVWREFVADFPATSFRDAGSLLSVAYSADDWVGTPNTLAPATEGEDDRILEALGQATRRLDLAGVAIDAPLGEVQFTKKYLTRLDLDNPEAEREFEKIPIGGAGPIEGVTNKNDYGSSKTTLGPIMPRGEVINAATDLTTEGYVINNGTSFIMTMEYTDDGPRAFAFVTYSQSDDPESPFHADQTRAFSEERWREVRYTEEAIAADPELEVEVVFGF